MWKSPYKIKLLKRHPTIKREKCNKIEEIIEGKIEVSLKSVGNDRLRELLVVCKIGISRLVAAPGCGQISLE